MFSPRYTPVLLLPPGETQGGIYLKTNNLYKKMKSKEYTLSNGIKVEQKELTLRKTAAIATLLVGTVVALFEKLLKGEESIEKIDIKEILMKSLMEIETANKFLNIILIPVSVIPEIDYLDLPNSDWIGAVEDFFVFNKSLKSLFNLMLSKLDSIKKISM